MARSSHGPRAVSGWADTQKPAPRPRIVRLGRAANDNTVRPRALHVLALATLVCVFAAGVLYYFGVF